MLLLVVKVMAVWTPCTPKQAGHVVMRAYLQLTHQHYVTGTMADELAVSAAV
jgi:hypothetical protein